jgi:hypothetical protein
MHGLTRYVTIDDSTAYKITILISDNDWDKNDKVIEAFFAGFAPGG